MNNENHGLSSENLKNIICKIYQNGYFTNHGPLAKQFEDEVESLLKLNNAVSVMNSALAVLVAISGSYRGGSVGVSSRCDQDVFDAINMTNIDFIRLSNDDFIAFNDLDFKMLVVPSKTLTKENYDYFRGLVELGVIVIICYASITDFSCREVVEGSLSIFTLGAGTLTQGGIIGTNNDSLAETFRNIRSSYGVRNVRKVKATCNGRFSEFQAGLGLELLRKANQL
jgi:dTDP-4-amino-4,6-dideoxygalactose transaminase